MKVNLRDSENTSVFGDVAINQIFGKVFLGGGVSAWDLTESDTRSIALLVQTGFDITSNGKLQLVAQARAPFNEMQRHRQQLHGLGRLPLPAVQREVVPGLEPQGPRRHRPARAFLVCVQHERIA